MFGPLFVVYHFLRRIMLGTVQFYHQFCFVTVKICDVISDDILPAKTAGIAAQESVPERAFLLGLVFAEILRISF